MGRGVLRRTGVALFTTLVLAAGCSGNGETASEDIAPAAAVPATEDELRAALIAEDDLPPGFGRDPSVAEHSVSRDPYCNYVDPNLDVPFLNRLTIGFVSNQAVELNPEGPDDLTAANQTISESIIQYESADDAGRFLELTRQAVAACPTEERTDDDAPYTIRLSPEPLDPVGDESLGVVRSVSGSVGDIAAYQGIVRQGTIVLVVVRSGDVDADFTADLIRTEWQGILTRALARAEGLE